MRVLTITCNASVDTSYLLPALTPGAIHRATQVLPQAGGKGNNVARILATLGHAPIATGFTGGFTGRFIESELQAQGIDCAFVRLDAASRTCLTIVEEDTGRTTEIRDPGAAIGPDDGERLLVRIGEIAPLVEAAVISGSPPPGAPADLYAKLVACLRRAGVDVALDASGDALRAGAAGGPTLIAPNRDEMAELLGWAPAGAPAPGEIVAAVQAWMLGRSDEDAGGDASTVNGVLVSLGAEGALLVRADAAFRARAPKIAAVNTVGCGDALLAGFLDARARGAGDADALAAAVAVGSAAALQPSIGVVDPADVARMRPDVDVASMTADILAGTIRR